MKSLVPMLGFGCFTASIAQAALPPYYQRTSEISAILKDRKVYELISQMRKDVSTGVIANISWKSGLSGRAGQAYEVHSGKCTVFVSAIYFSNLDGIGPQKFEIQPSDEVACSD